MPIGDSELILNADGSIYHLNLIPEDISDTIILVGDPNRVPLVSRHFDSIDLCNGIAIVEPGDWVRYHKISL